MEKILLYAEDLSDLAGTSPFDESAFQVYQAIGSALVDSASDHLTHKELLASFSSAIGLFSEMMQLKSGLSMELLWSLFRENTPYDSSIQHRHEIEKLSDSFDSLPWPSEAPLKVLDALRSSIVQIFESLVYSDGKGLRTLKVCQRIHHIRYHRLTVLGYPKSVRRHPQCPKCGFPTSYWAYFPTFIRSTISVLSDDTYSERPNNKTIGSDALIAFASAYQNNDR